MKTFLESSSGPFRQQSPEPRRHRRLPCELVNHLWNNLGRHPSVLNHFGFTGYAFRLTAEPLPAGASACIGCNPPVGFEPTPGFQVKREIHGGVWGDTCTAVASLGGGSGTLTFVEGIPANANGTFAQISSSLGYDLTLLANPIGSTAVIPIANFHVVNNTGGVYTVTPDPVAAGIAVGSVFEMRALPTIISSTTIGDPNFVNAYAPNGFGTVGNEEVGHRLRIVKGTGRGQERSITANTNDTLTVGKAWDTTPDNTSRFIIEEAAWQDAPYSTQSAGAMPVTPPSPIPSVGVITFARGSPFNRDIRKKAPTASRRAYRSSRILSSFA